MFNDQSSKLKLKNAYNKRSADLCLQSPWHNYDTNDFYINVITADDIKVNFVANPRGRWQKQEIFLKKKSSSHRSGRYQREFRMQTLQTIATKFRLQPLPQTTPYQDTVGKILYRIRFIKKMYLKTFDQSQMDDFNQQITYYHFHF